MSLSRRNFLRSAPALAALATGGLSLTKAGRARAAGAGGAPGEILMVVSNEVPHPTMGFPLGFWAAELTHPFAEFAAHRHPITIASLNGGPVAVDAYSDPRHESGYSAHDFVSLGFLTSPPHAALLQDTPALADLDPERFAAIVIAGGQGPMVTYRDHAPLQALVRHFYLSGKPTAALCHGVAALLDVQLPDGRFLLEGKTVTGFSAAEDAFVDETLGVTMWDWWVEPAMRERGAHYVQGGLWANFAVADGNLITGQQQNSGGSVARLVLDQLAS